MKEDEYSLSGVRFQREEVELEPASPSRPQGGGFVTISFLFRTVRAWGGTIFTMVGSV